MTLDPPHGPIMKRHRGAACLWSSFMDGADAPISTMGAMTIAAGLRLRLARRMRRWADRLDYDGAPKLIAYSFTFEDHEGIRFRDDGKGCRLAFLGGEENYRRAHDESDTAARKRAEWEALPEEYRVFLRQHGVGGP